MPIHKRILAGAKGFVLSGFNPVAGAGAFLAPVKRPARNVIPRTLTARPTLRGEAGKGLGRRIKFGGGRGAPPPGMAGLTAISQPKLPCIFPFKPDPVTGDCKLFLGDQPGPDGVPLQIGAGLPVGDAVMGQFGAALVPGSKIVDRAICLRGMVVASDGLCYNKSQIKNSDRMWPRGRRPLLTGGDMSAIAKAARAASRLERTTKRLQKIGLMKKPATGASRRQIAAEVRTEIHHSK